jgi:Zn-dependent peptidase ImmA (M78 family)
MFGTARLAGFVSRHKLHAKDIPISLTSLSDIYDIRYVPLSPGVLGFGFFARGLRIVGVNADQPLYVQRMALAHEVSHHILRHPNSMFLCRADSWQYNHLELRAQHAASAMLIPFSRLMCYLTSGATISEMAEAFQVPEELVRIRCHLADCVAIDKPRATLDWPPYLLPAHTHTERERLAAGKLPLNR